METALPLRILIVEDDVIDRRRLERLLAQSSLGRCEMQNADRLGRALDALREHAFDIILLDLGLPDSTGMEAAVRLQSQAPGTPIIVLSGLDDPDVATQAVQIGVQDYLIKGQVDANLLTRAVRCALERKRAECQLQAAELRYRTIFDNLAVGIMMVDAQRRLVSWNQFTERLLGMGGAELRGRNVECLYPPHEWERIWELNLRRKGMQHHLETQMIRGDGQIIDVDISLSIARDSAGGVTGSIGVIRDITERRRMEEALLVKDSALQCATSGIVLVDLDGYVTFSNPSALKMWGYDTDERVVGRHLTVFVQSAAEGLAAYRAAVQTGAWNGELIARRQDGSDFIVQVSASLVKDSEGKALCLMGSLADVTERRRMHEILDRKQRNLEAIFDAAPLGMLLVNQHLRVVRANEMIRHISGKGYGDVIDHDVCRALGCLRSTPDEGGGEAARAHENCLFRTTIQRVLASGRSARGVEVRPLLNADGEPAQPWLSVSVEPVLVDGTRHVVVALNDVTDRKRAEEELKETMEMKSQFISTVSHELRTPMTSMKEAVSIVRDGLAGKLNPDQKRFLDIAQRNLDRLARLIDDVLDFQKLSAGKMRLRLEARPPGPVVEEAYTTMLPQAAKSQVDLSLDLETNLPAVVCDADRIVQVLTNLLSNALKFTPEGGRVRLSVHRRAEQLAIRVSDTGYGIPQEDLPKLFSQFFRVQRPGKEIKGTGLGLAIASRIVTGHGGRIEVESELGKGTTFTVLLPCAGPAPAASDTGADRSLEGLLAGP
jgi:PAS domain S-box-containing protein